MINFFMELKENNLILTKTVDEWTFSGYDDKLLEMASTLNISNFKIPYKKFGWFYGVSSLPYTNVVSLLCSVCSNLIVDGTNRRYVYLMGPYRSKFHAQSTATASHISLEKLPLLTLSLKEQ